MLVFLQQGNQNCIQCFKYDLTNILYSCNIASQCPDQQRHAYQTSSAPCVPTFMELNSLSFPSPVVRLIKSCFNCRQSSTTINFNLICKLTNHATYIHIRNLIEAHHLLKLQVCKTNLHHHTVSFKPTLYLIGQLALDSMHSNLTHQPTMQYLVNNIYCSFLAFFDLKKNKQI